MQPLIAIFRNWTFALFYTLANLWGSVVVSLLFWGFSNDITTVDEAKKYYPLFGLMANVALIFSGQYVKYVSNLRTDLPLGGDPWGRSLKLLMSAVVAGGCVVMGLMGFMQTQVECPSSPLLPTAVHARTGAHRPRLCRSCQRSEAKEAKAHDEYGRVSRVPVQESLYQGLGDTCDR